jgi:hypothetical protein
LEFQAYFRGQRPPILGMRNHVLGIKNHTTKASCLEKKKFLENLKIPF